MYSTALRKGVLNSPPRFPARERAGTSSPSAQRGPTWRLLAVTRCAAHCAGERTVSTRGFCSALNPTQSCCGAEQEKPFNLPDDLLNYANDQFHRRMIECCKVYKNNQRGKTTMEKWFLSLSDMVFTATEDRKHIIIWLNVKILCWFCVAIFIDSIRVKSHLVAAVK